MLVSQKQPSSRFCFVCGVENPVGLRINFYHSAEGEVSADINLPAPYQGYPGVTHGGIIASILDEAAGRAHMTPDPNDPRFMFTARLDIQYRKNVPTETPLKLVGRAGALKGRTASASSAIYNLDGELLAEAQALLVRVPEDMLQNADLESLGWRVYPD
jgi:acyl-coenzyme A thioesterase PaaI-like protein